MIVYKLGNVTEVMNSVSVTIFDKNLETGFVDCAQIRQYMFKTATCSKTGLTKKKELLNLSIKV